MFLKNTTHLQQDLLGIESYLPEAKRKKLRTSSDAYFYEIVFSRIDENDFAPLFSSKGSRPNAPVNALVSAIILCHKRGWTIEELFDRIDFDLRVRTALGLHNLEDTPFCAATYFNFQNRLLKYFTETGDNLIEKVFDKLTTEQLKKLKIETDIQRMDSFQAMSNIRTYSRTQLLVEMLIRLYRILSVVDQQKFKEMLVPYISQTSGKFIYGLKRSEITHELEKLSIVYHDLYQQLKTSYGDTDIFRIFERVYTEHFRIVSDKIEVKDSQEITTSSLQSPDDIDATFRQKKGENYRGQVVNVTETANTENKLNLITDVAVEANNIDDSTILNHRIDAIKEKSTDLNELHTDGGYGSSDNDKKMQKHNINHIQTAVRGRSAAVDMKLEHVGPDQHRVSCPMQTTHSQKTRTRFKAQFDASICENCSHADICPTVKQKGCRVFYFTQDMVDMQNRVRAIEQLPVERRTLRPNIEASIKEYTKAFNHKGKLRVRGKFKTMLFAFAMSIGINFGRIFRFLLENPNFCQLKPLVSTFFVVIGSRITQFYRCLRFVCRKFQRTGYLFSIC